MSESVQDIQNMISPISEVIQALREGSMVIIVDEEDRENEGDLLMASQFITPADINFMVTHARGLVCLTLTQEQSDRLGLSLMSSKNGTQYGTNFTTSIEAAEGVTTGISASDRAKTIQVASHPKASPEDIVTPGHIFPIIAKRGGVLERAGHTEAGCDLTRLAGLTPSSVICEILNEDGTMARLPQLIEFAKKHQLKIGTIADLIEYRSMTESLIERMGERILNTAWGEFRTMFYEEKGTDSVHMALVHGDISEDKPVWVRVHEPTTLLDVLSLDHIGHSWDVGASLAFIQKKPAGVFVMLNCQREHDNGLKKQIQQVLSDDVKEPTPKQGSSLRTYGLGAQILRDLGVKQMNLLAHPRKMPNMSGFALEVLSFEAS